MAKGKLSTDLIGYSTAIIQAVFYSSIGIFSKFLYATGLDAQQVMILRFIATVVYLGALLLIWRKYPLFSKQPALYVQSAFFFVTAWTYLLAVQYINAGLVTVIFYTYPAVVAVLDVVIFKNKFTWRILLAIAFSLFGMLLISGLLEPQDLQIDPIGILLAIVSCLSFSGYTLLIQKTARVDSSFTSMFSLGVVCLACSLVFFFPKIPSTLASVDLYTVLMSSGMAIIATILPLVLYTVAIRYIGATKASILGLVETPASLFLCWLFLGETLTVLQGIGAAFVVMGVLFITVKPAKTDIKSEGR